MAAGIEVRHSKKCTGKGKCNCKPSYRAVVWNGDEGRFIRRTFDSRAAAKMWREDALHALGHGYRPETARTLREAAEEWMDAADVGSVHNRKGQPYKPSALRGYRRSLEKRVLPALGHHRLADVQRRDVQRFVDEMVREGCDPSTIKNTLNPLQAIYRHAERRDEVRVNPTRGLELPAVRGKRDRIESPERAAEFVAALPDSERALWACAFYAGLRRGELQELRWSDVDLDANVIRVERAYDDEGREVVETKTDAGVRVVPMAGALRRELVAHKLRTGRAGDDLVLGFTDSARFVPSTIEARAKKAWRAASLDPITLHEARHCCASYLIAAGLDLKRLSRYMGHASVVITLDRYGHLLPGGEAESAAQLDAFFERGKTREKSSVSGGRERSGAV